jgi:hypothetical protein
MSAHPTCSICHRPLKDLESIKLGVGPECRGKLPGFYQSRSCRTTAFVRGQPVALNDKTVFKKVDGVWVAEDGYTMSDKRFQDYLTRYGFIDQHPQDSIKQGSLS